jgi:hypothetical protein
MIRSVMQDRVQEGEVFRGDSAERVYSLGRVLAISNGVFALTLLVVQLAVSTTGETRGTSPCWSG